MASQKKYHLRKSLGQCTECETSLSEWEQLLCLNCSKNKRLKQRLWHNENRDRDNQKQRLKYAELKLRVYALFGNKCNCCGETEQDFLSMDHEGGWGKDHRASLKAKGKSIGNEASIGSF